jgi:hypothetical protein
VHPIACCVQGFGPPIKTEVDESLGGNAKAQKEEPPAPGQPLKLVPMDDNARALLDSSHMIYKAGGQPGMAGELGKAVAVNKNVRLEFSRGFVWGIGGAMCVCV